MRLILDVEAGRTGQDVELDVLSIDGFDTCLGDPLDVCKFTLDVVLNQCLKVAITRAMGSSSAGGHNLS